jgi:hypothetical protein
MRTFEELQEDLGAAIAANRPGSGIPHVVIALPSHSVGEALLSHYGARVLALEHRFLLSSLLTHRLPDADWVYISSLAPTAEVVDYYRRLGPRPENFSSRTHVLSVDDHTPRSMAAKMLDRPELLDHIHELVDGRVAVIEPWNVTDHEVAVAEALQLPMNGLDPRMLPLGFKSGGRRLFRQAGVPVPFGVEDVRTADDVVRAIQEIRAARPTAPGVVVKHDDSGAGDGNVVLDLRELGLGDTDTADVRRLLRARVNALPGWYLAELRHGGIVEELLTGTDFTSPSAQIDLLPGGEVEVLATHEQVLGGESGQVFLGCRFPADPAYAGLLARHAEGIGAVLAQAGACGRASVDFAAVRSTEGTWQVYALEVNLRKGGTTHPYAVLRNLVPGRYDARQGGWVADADQLPRSYACTDNLHDPAWLGLPAASVISAVRDAGLEFNHRTGTGVVLHMLAGLGIDGRFGVTAIAPDAVGAQASLDRTHDVVAATAVAQAGSRSALKVGGVLQFGRSRLLSGRSADIEYRGRG